jgi:hypothetical protein
MCNFSGCPHSPPGKILSAHILLSHERANMNVDLHLKSETDQKFIVMQRECSVKTGFGITRFYTSKIFVLSLLHFLYYIVSVYNKTGRSSGDSSIAHSMLIRNEHYIKINLPLF